MADEKELLVRIKGLDELTPVMLKAMQSMEASASKLADSVDKINPPLGNTKKGTDGLNTGVVNLAATLGVLKMAVDAGVAVFNALSGQIGMAIDEALEAEQALNQLNGALVSQGLYTEQAVSAINDYVAAVEEQTGVSGEAIQKMIAMGVQMGLSVEQSQRMEEAARKLAAATGVDVMTAFNQLQGAMTGQARALAKVLPGVRDLTEAQLKQGAAVDLVNAQLDAQYKLYQGSFANSLERAKNALSNVYENVGKIIIQNPLVVRGLNLFTDWMLNLTTAVESADKWIRENQAQIEKFGSALLKAAGFVAVVSGAVGVATVGITGLGAALAFVTGPIGLTIAAVAALTAAFYRWPGLFDQIVGSFRIFVGFFLQGIGWIAEKTAALVSIFDKDLAQSLKNVASGLDEQSNKWQLAGAQQVEYGIVLNDTAGKAEAASQREVAAIDNTLAAQSKLNAATKERAQLYDGISIGTETQRQALLAEQQDRDKNLKDFTAWLEAKKRVAISKSEEQEMELAKVRAGAMKDSGGPEGTNAAAQVELDNERKKQSDLKVLRDQGILSESQYQESLLASKQRYAQIEQQQALAHRQALADALGTSEEAYQMREQIEEERFQLKLQQRMERAELEGATEEQIRMMRDEEEAIYRQQRLDALDAHYAEIASREEISGATVTATRQKWFREQEKAQADSIKNFASGVTLMVSIQSAMNQTFSKLGDALVKNQKVTAQNMTGVFLEMFGRQVQQKGFGDLVMGLFPPNPVQLAVGAAEVAAGTAIARAGVSMQGGQADEGMDYIPQSLAGKSFVLSQGERVIQPSANKELTDFLNREKLANQQGGGARGGQQISVTLHYNGMGSEQDARAMAEIVVREIRSMSERGTPIMSDKGIVKSN